MKKSEARVESFQDEPFSRWSAISGNWKVEDEVEIADIDKKAIYKSPEEPSDVAWVGLWKEADGSIKIRFPQIIGDPGLEPSYKPWYGRFWQKYPGIDSWADFCKQQKMREGPANAIERTKLDYITMVSHDGGVTWDNLGPGEDSSGNNSKPVLASDGSLIDGGRSTIICGDGRIVQTISGYEWLKASLRSKSKYLLGIRESVDNGKTWSETQQIIPEWKKDGINRWTEENTIVELKDGRILVLIRTMGIDVGVAQTYLTRTATGKYVASPTIKTIMPHSGVPDLIRSSDGTIWYWGCGGHYYSADEGQTWKHLPEEYRFSSYYGKMIEAKPNRVLCVTQRGISDSPYPHNVDAYIEQVSFSHRRVGVMKQTDTSSSLALVRMNEGRYKDLHISVDVRLDKAHGVAFHISPDGKSFYVFATIMPGTEAYKRWAFPEMQDEVLSAWHPGILETHAPDDRVLPVIVLARVENGKIKVLRGMGIGNVKKGEWMQLQVKVKDDLIQAAVKKSNSSLRHTYIGIRDSAYKEGGIGLITDDGSLGEFKNLHVWSSPQMIRDLWSLKSYLIKRRA